MPAPAFGTQAIGGPVSRPISFSVHPLVYRNVERRAGDVGVRPAEYARRLFEAAYAVRCAQEKDERHEDAELDMQVRLAFVMADAEPEFIAAAIGATEATVARILDGWRRWFAEGAPRRAPAGQPPARDAPEGGAAAAPAAAAKPASAKYQRWSDQDILTLKEMWAAGKEAAEIAAALGRTAATVQAYASTHRGLCPRRRG